MQMHRSQCALSEAVNSCRDWMTRLADFYNRSIDRYESLGRRAPLRFAVLTIALLFGLVFAVFTPGFDTNDDAVMNMVVAGKGYGLVPDEHMVFTNVLIGFVLKGLYTLWPALPWYGGYLLAVHFAAQSIMLYCVIRPGYTRLRLRLYLVYFATAGLYLVNNLQFTSTAFLAGQSGILLLMLAIGRWDQADGRRWRWLWCGAAFLLLLLSSLIRREVFYPVVGLAIPTCGLVALAGRRPVRNSLAVIGLAVAAFVSATACWRFNHAYYESDPGWSGFYEYNKVRVKFNDEAWVRYSAETAHLFQEVNWSENDFEMLSAWFFDNEDLYNFATLNHVLAQYPWQQSRVSAQMFVKRRGHRPSRLGVPRAFLSAAHIGVLCRAATSEFRGRGAGAGGFGRLDHVSHSVFQDAPQPRLRARARLSPRGSGMPGSRRELSAAGAFSHLDARAFLAAGRLAKCAALSTHEVRRRGCAGAVVRGRVQGNVPPISPQP